MVCNRKILQLVLLSPKEYEYHMLALIYAVLHRDLYTAFDYEHAT